MQVVLVSTYDLGHSPFGLASGAAWLRNAGHAVHCLDLAVEGWNVEVLQAADWIGFYLPMHTATRLAAFAIRKVKSLNASAKLIAFGLYAPLNAEYLQSLGVDVILGGEFEAGLLRVMEGSRPADLYPIERLQFQTPARDVLPSLSKYSKLHAAGEVTLAGYTESSRGCKHLCRHCPVVPVYQGSFRVVAPEVVLGDVRQQVEAGARHITFGDPDFFNGPTHARRIVEDLHREFPDVTYDATIKVEHLLRHRDLLPVLRDTCCLFVTSAVESLQDPILERLQKGHTRADVYRAIELMRANRLTLAPTFIPFTPWDTMESYRALLQSLVDLDLIEAVSPVQLALRLLIPQGSRLLELEDIRDAISGFDQSALLHRWSHSDPRMDSLAGDALHFVHAGTKRKWTRSEIFSKIWELAHGAPPPEEHFQARATVPYLDEPWFC